MRWMKELGSALEMVLSRWFFSASPGPTAFANPWSPGLGPWRFGERTARVAEPQFTPFDLGSSGAEAQCAGPVETAVRERRAPATLTELGIPPGLAHDLEVVFRAMGATRGGQVVGYEFRTLDGATHAFRLEESE
jgi:hypothetical protein